MNLVLSKLYKMKTVKFIFLTLFISTVGYTQNVNLSNGEVFDGEPFLAINPNQPQQMVVAWMGYLPLNQLVIKIRTTVDAGQNWSEITTIPHKKPIYTSADPSVEFDNNGNVYLAYVDYSHALDSGAVYLRKSVDGGLNWGEAVEVITMHAEVENKKPIDRPWMAIDKSGGDTDGNIYITTMNALKGFPLVTAPYHPYFMRSTDGGNSFSTWQHLDTDGWIAGNIIRGAMANPTVSANGTLHIVYPSWYFPQSFYPQFFIASSANAGTSFERNLITPIANNFSDELAKKGYLLIADPSNNLHLAFINLEAEYGDGDVFLRESFDAGANWTEFERVNDDPIENNRMQDLVWADFDQDGDLVVSWRDRRNAPDSTYTTSTEIWAAVKCKDSSHFSTNFIISDLSVAHDTILEGAGNDFMCIAFENDTINAVWGDTRDGKLNIWFQRIKKDGSFLSIQKIASETNPIINVYPNPATNELHITGQEILEITLYNQTGKMVYQTKNKNTIESITVNVNTLEKGMYYVKVKTKQGIVLKNWIKL